MTHQDNTGLVARNVIYVYCRWSRSVTPKVKVPVDPGSRSTGRSATRRKLPTRRPVGLAHEDSVHGRVLTRPEVSQRLIALENSSLCMASLYV